MLHPISHQLQRLERTLWLLRIAPQTACQRRRPPQRWAARTAVEPRFPSHEYEKQEGEEIDPAAIQDWSLDDRTALTAKLVHEFVASSSQQQKKPRAREQQVAPPAHPAAAPTGPQRLVVDNLLGGGFDEALLSSTPVHTLNWAIKTLGRQQRLDLAEQLFHWMRVRQLANEHSFVKLCEACEAVRLPHRAMQAMRTTARLPTSFKLEERAAAALLKTFRVTGDLRGALRALDELRQRGVLLNQYAFNVVIRNAADAGDVDAAFLVAEQLRKHPGAASDARTMSALLAAVAASQRWSRMATVHKMMAQEGVAWDSVLSLQLMSGYACAGRPEAAEAVMDAMLDDGMRPKRHHWNALLMAYAEARSYEGCLGAYTRMTEGAGLVPDAYSMVALLHAGAGARAGAAAAAWVEALMQRHDISLNVEIATAMISSFRHAPPGVERVRAVKAAHRVLRMLRSTGLQPNVRTFNSLMAVLADAEDWQGVKAVMDELEKCPEVEPDDATWSIAMRAFQEAHQFRLVEEVERLRDTWETLHPKEEGEAGPLWEKRGARRG